MSSRTPSPLRSRTPMRSSSSPAIASENGRGAISGGVPHVVAGRDHARHLDRGAAIHGVDERRAIDGMRDRFAQFPRAQPRARLAAAPSTPLGCPSACSGGEVEPEHVGVERRTEFEQLQLALCGERACLGQVVRPELGRDDVGLRRAQAQHLGVLRRHDVEPQAVGPRQPRPIVGRAPVVRVADEVDGHARLVAREHERSRRPPCPPGAHRWSRRRRACRRRPGSRSGRAAGSAGRAAGGGRGRTAPGTTARPSAHRGPAP